MRGFFEHQYLSFKKSHVRNLIALAKADGTFHEKEEALIYKLGKKYGLKDKHIKGMIESEDKFDLIVPDNHEDKMDELFDLMQIVYADGVVEDDEVRFCEDIVAKFSFKKEIVPWLIDLFATEEVVTPQEWEDAKLTALKFAG